MKLKLRLPHVFIFLFSIIVVCSVLSYVIPSGVYKRQKKVINKIEQSVVISGSYNQIPKHISPKGVLLEDRVEGHAEPTSVFSVLTSVPKGLEQSASLIFFIFMIGAVFSVIVETKTIHAFLSGLIKRFERKPVILFFLIYVLVSTGSAFMGIYIELIPMIPILIILAKQNGYDRMFGFALGVLPVYVGWSTATTNPFTVQIAQQIAELPIGSGMGLRFIVFIIAIFMGFFYLLRYGKKIKNGTGVSLTDSMEVTSGEKIEHVKLTKIHIRILVVLVIGYAGILSAVQFMGWGLIEMTAGFLAIGIVTMLISDFSGDEAMVHFVNGLKSMIIPALIVGVARAISIVMQESMIMDTILYGFSSALSALPKSLAAIGMLAFQSFLNFFIPSASGQALVSMPLMTPLSDLLGLSRQTAVLAYVFGDGFSNMVIPTNGVLLAMLGVGNVPFNKWIRFVFPIFTALMILAVATMIVAILIGYK
ncbi:YfcC family protein [Lentiprolixibacter aurantiacus]|uniref:TIGR00366 family protein n=1 Tax=Lentiprolixibacter aurantiacus TaxID=2993939 RepID=A0AAE3SP25_9FLAO|nr:TIGR00366 family protein [Lentiprolixibacter aurantiacus]MCX2719761.1 TIGR00366 family protein [Lentiprolixibacter aurantiacus]